MNEVEVSKIIDLYFSTKSLSFDKSLYYDVDSDIFIPINETQLEINTLSIYFNQILLRYIENIQKQTIPLNIDEAFCFIDEFEKQTKSNFNCENVIDAYSEVINGLKSYVFYSFHNKGIINIYDLYKSLNENKKYRFQEYFFKAIILLDPSVEIIFEFISSINSNKTLFPIDNFCVYLVKNKPQKAEGLYNYTLSKNDSSNNNLLSNLLIQLFEINEEETLSKVKELLTSNPTVAYCVLGRLKYKQESQIIECFKIAQSSDSEDLESLVNIAYIYKSLIVNAVTSVDIKEECFRKIKELYKIDNNNLKNSILMDCRCIEGYEKERYDIFISAVLPASENVLELINDYFYWFKNPDYFFDLFEHILDLLFLRGVGMVDVRFFEKAFSHFWSICREKSEEHILILLSHNKSYLRIGAVNLLMNSHIQNYKVDLLKLQTEQQQLRAIEAVLFCGFYNIEKLLPLIICFWNSPYSKVVGYLQERLSYMIFESYNDYLYELIIKHVSDKAFLKPLKDSLYDYHALRKEKEAINDLNPYKNEHDFMNSFYNLEDEHQKKIMKSHDKNNSFLSMFKNTIIVRGNSWKIGGNDVSPLSKFEHSFQIDLNMIKNPDLFNHLHNTFNSKF